MMAICASLHGHDRIIRRTTMHVNILEAKNRLSQRTKPARAGGEVVIANRGEPVARLVPARETPGAAPGAGSARAILDWLDHPPLAASARRSPAALGEAHA